MIDHFAGLHEFDGDYVLKEVKGVTSRKIVNDHDGDFVVERIVVTPVGDAEILI